MEHGAVDFATSLRAYRERAGMSQNALARASGLNPASINRLESGERSASNRALVEQICAALELPAADRDRLLTLAGHLPAAYDGVPASDPALVAAAAVLGSSELSDDEKQEFREVVERIAARWLHSRGAR